jgi:hypothetical protein
MRAPSHLRRNVRLQCALEALVKRNVHKRCQFYLYELSSSILVYFPRGVGSEREQPTYQTIPLVFWYVEFFPSVSIILEGDILPVQVQGQS